MKAAILQYKFNTPLEDFTIEKHDFDHHKIGNYIHENLQTATLMSAGIFHGEIDHPSEDETNAADLYFDIYIDFENPELVENYRNDPQAVTDYVYDIFEPSIVVVHQHFKVGNDQYFIVAHGDAVENLLDEKP